MLDSIARETNTNFTKIGIIQPMDEGFWMIKTLGENIPIQPKGWDHFLK
ncbi:hypothetical protein GF337_11845 [candidate division KSB1 bacterium]|nr:hypothetical protein [candidate division KSB1 bacterium]